MKRSLFIPILCCIFCNFVHSNRSNRPITPLTMNDIEEFVRGEMISLRQDIHADREKQGYLMRKLISYMAGLQIRDEHGMENQNSMLEILSDIMENQHLSMIEQAGLATQLQYIINQTIDKRNASEEVSKDGIIY